MRDASRQRRREFFLCLLHFTSLIVFMHSFFSSRFLTFSAVCNMYRFPLVSLVNISQDHEKIPMQHPAIVFSSWLFFFWYVLVWFSYVWSCDQRNLLKSFQYYLHRVSNNDTNREAICTPLRNKSVDFNLTYFS
jgi:hypothetical protein